MLDQGNATLRHVREELRHRDEFVVIDDVDALYAHRSASASYEYETRCGRVSRSAPTSVLPGRRAAVRSQLLFKILPFLLDRSFHSEPVGSADPAEGRPAARPHLQ